MDGMRTLVSVVGARPQFVKLAPVARALAAREGVVHRVVHTGQHYDENMSARLFEELELPAPDLNLGVGSGSHAGQTAAMLIGLEAAFTDHMPAAVVVYGDTNSTLAATLVASKMHIPVAHVEAGLRSHNRLMPEEINRLVADHCADRLYAPTPRAMSNLESEDLAGRAVLSGDVMLDALLRAMDLAESGSRMLNSLKLESGRFALVTIHRPANTSASVLEFLMRTLEDTARQHVPLVFPLHPRTRAVLDRIGYTAPAGVHLIEPLAYLDMVALLRAAAVVITDSGGVQKEAAFLHTPCLTLRSETEWIETVEIGVNRLVAGDDLASSVGEVLAAPDVFDEPTLERLREHYGTGSAAAVIVDDLVQWIS